MKTYRVYTDGSCLGNPGPGGIGYLVINPDGSEREQSAHAAHTTNNQMELTAAILAIASFDEPSHIILTTDSNYVKNGITQWIHNWKRNGWKTAQRKPVKNGDLWKLLDAEVYDRCHKVEWHWVKGHSKHPENERVDKLAQDGARND